MIERVLTVPAFVWRGGFLSRAVLTGVAAGVTLGALAWLDSGLWLSGVCVLVIAGIALFLTLFTMGPVMNRIGDEAYANAKTYQVDQPIRHGLIENWDHMERFWEQCIFKYLRAEPEDHYFMLTEPPLNPPENRENTAEIMFESFNIKGLYIAVQAVLALALAGLAVVAGDGGRGGGLRGVGAEVGVVDQAAEDLPEDLVEAVEMLLVLHQRGARQEVEVVQAPGVFGARAHHARLQGFEQGEVFLHRHGQLGRAQGVEEVNQHDFALQRLLGKRVPL